MKDGVVYRQQCQVTRLRAMSLEWTATSPDTDHGFVPQAMKTIRSKDTRSISLGMYVVFTVGLAFWLAYGIVLGSWPMIVSNIITLGLSSTILALKLKHG